MSKSDKIFDIIKDTALYVVMMGHSTRNNFLCHIQGCGNKRWYFPDNYYTRHTLAKQLKEFTDEETHMIGTCKMNIIDSANKENVQQAVRIIAKNNTRNDWILVRAYDGLEKVIPVTGKRSREKNKKHNEINKKTVAPNCGYILWKDRKVVVFYTNDLSGTPTNDFLHIAKETDSEELIRCVGGLVDIKRWDDECRNVRRMFSCLVCITVYNKLMNGVDCKDQRIETMVCSRKEHKMSTLMYTHVLDFSLSNAYALYLFLYGNNKIYWS